VSAPENQTPEAVQQLITQAGAELLREVRIERGTDERLTVHVYPVPAGEKELLARLFRVPAISRSNLRLKIHVLP
jgi:hypothetical protein